MNRLILCEEPKASHPYYLETIGKSIYTMEELCFYLWQYAHLLDVKQFHKQFSGWVGNELGQEQLAEQLEKLRRQSAALEERVMAVFDSISYLDGQQREQYVKTLQDVSHMTPFERRRRMADDLVRNKKYYRAIQEYQELLKQKEAEDEQVAATLYHNMGVANCRMFLFRQGSEYFLKSFMLVPGKDKLREYKTCLQLCEEKIQEDAMIAEFPGAAAIDMQVYGQIEELSSKDNDKKKATRQLKQLKQDGKIAQYYQTMEHILHDWNEECREYMRNQT